LASFFAAVVSLGGDENNTQSTTHFTYSVLTNWTLNAWQKATCPQYFYGDKTFHLNSDWFFFDVNSVSAGYWRILSEPASSLFASLLLFEIFNKSG
jgi:hypothetical protein